MHINDLVPSLFDITNFHFNLSSFLTRSTQSIVDMVLQNTLLCLAFILEPFNPIWIMICRHLQRVDTERWRELYWVYGTCIPSISTEHVEVVWAGLGYVRKGILVGWVILAVGIALALTWSWLLSRLYTKSNLPRILFENDNVLDNPPLPSFTLGSATEVEDGRSASNASSSKRGFTSTSSTRSHTTTTSASTQTNPNKEQERQNILQPLYKDRSPPHLILLQYIHPNSSLWPPYYLQAFHKAQESIEKMKEGRVTSHIDAPPSGNTRRSKTDWAGKIVLDRTVVEKDLIEGRIGYRDGVKNMINWEGVRWL